ncbi:MAG: glycoside hydrolase family 108 protein [Desulfuromonadaceae bacterium]
MSHFDKAILSVLRHEGGYVNHPSDPGGETNFGICKRSYPKLDIKALTKEEAIEIYRTDYWRYAYDKMPYRIAAKIFDIAVNMGYTPAHKILQRAVGAVDDGIVGPRTLELTNGMDEQTVLDNISEEQKKYYQAIIKRRPESAVFMAGWTKRAEWQPGEGVA